MGAKNVAKLRQWLEAAAHGDLETVRALIKGGINVNAPAADGRTALMLACSGGQAHIVEALLQAKADVHLTTKMGRSALDHATGIDWGGPDITAKTGDYPGTIRLLVQAGAVVTRETLRGAFALTPAAFAELLKGQSPVLRDARGLKELLVQVEEDAIYSSTRGYQQEFDANVKAVRKRLAKIH